MTRHDRRRSRVAVVVALGSLACVALSAPAAADELIVVAGGDTAATLPVERKTTATFPFEPAAGVEPAKLADPAIVRLRREGREIAADPEVAVALKRDVPALVFDVKGLERAAAYTVVVQLTEGGRRQQLTFTLTRPVAVLSVPTKLEAERTVGYLGHDMKEEKRPGLRLRSGPDSRASVYVSQVEDESGEIEFPDPDLTVGPNEATTVPYAFNGDFPLGTVTRTVEIRSPQLTEPLRVPIEVTTRRDRTMILWLILLGALFGLATRAAVPSLQKRAAARRTELGLRAQLQGLAETRGDAKFRDDIKAAIAHLDGSFLKTSEIEAAVKTTRAAAEAAVRALDARVAAASARLLAVRAVLVRPRALPRPVAEEVERAGVESRAAEGAIATADGDGACADVDDAVAAVERARRESDTWLLRYAQALAMIDAATTKVTFKAGSFFAMRSVASATARLVTPAPPEPDPEPDPTPDAGDAAPAAADEAARLAVARRRLDQLDEVGATFEGVRRWVRELADEVDAVAEAVPAPALAPRASRLRAVGARDPSGLEELAEEVAELPDALRAALPGTAHALADEGNLLGAAAAAAAKPEQIRLGGTKVAASEAAGADADATATSGVGDTFVLPMAAPSLLRQIALVPGYTAVAAITLVAAFVQLVVSLGVATLFGYPLFADSWTGTLADVAKVVAWAFAADLGVEGIKRLAASAAPPAVPAPAAAAGG